LALQAMSIFVPPLRSLLGLSLLSLGDLLVVGGLSVLPLLINETTKPEGASRS
jgi:hypothetical protein